MSGLLQGKQKRKYRHTRYQYYVLTMKTCERSVTNRQEAACAVVCRKAGKNQIFKTFTFAV